MYPDSCGPHNKFHTSSTEQKPPTHPHCMHYNTTSREDWLHCVSTQGKTGVAVQFATYDQKNATQVQKCIAIFYIKISYYVALFRPISSKLDFLLCKILKVNCYLCRPLQPRYHRKKERWTWVGGYGAHKGMAYCHIHKLSNAPLGNESPIYRQCDELHPKREIEFLCR